MKIKIENPCNEDWNAMKIGLVSRHCDACEKSVFDFTNKTKEEILTFLIQNQNKSICGRFKKTQIDFHHDELEVIIEGLKTQKNNKYAFAILSLACLAMVSCSSEVDNEDPIMGQIETEIAITDTTQDSVPACEVQKRKIKGNVALDSIAPEIYIDEVIVGDVVYIPDGDDPLVFAEKMPEFQGGMDSLFSFLSANLVYSVWEKKNDIQGKVYVNFVIEKDGSINDIKILRSVEGSKNFDAEVIRVIEKMPKWIPAEQKGEKVAISYNLPINFSLKD